MSDRNDTVPPLVLNKCDFIKFAMIGASHDDLETELCNAPCIGTRCAMHKQSFCPKCNYDMTLGRGFFCCTLACLRCHVESKNVDK